MKQRLIRLLALSSLLMFVMTGLAAAASSSGNLELRGVITDVEDNTDVNEYVNTEPMTGLPCHRN